MDTGPLRVAQVLQDKRLIALEMRLLLCAVTGASRVQLVTQSERSLTAAEAERLETLIRRRLAGEPIAYLLGEKEFFGRVFEVSPAVLIPRPETELLIELALQHMPQGARVLDLGTGSGAIAVTLACERPDTTLVACDLSAAALEVATANASRHGVEV